MLKCSDSAIAGHAVLPGRRDYGFSTSQFRIDHPFDLTEREDQVLRLIANGNTSKDCARILGISWRTVHIHWGNCLEKMQARNASHAIAIGFASGLLTKDDLGL